MIKLRTTASSALLGLGIAMIGIIPTAASAADGQANPLLRPPAVPLVACDPYFSIWSPADKLADADTVHWTGKAQRLTSLVRIDGKVFRLMGKEPANEPVLPQTQLDVQPTRTIYTLEGGGISLTLTFMTAALPGDIDVLSRPVTYMTFECHAIDGRQHRVETYLDVASELAVNTPDQEVVWSKEKMGGVTALKTGSKEQMILGKKGDDIRIDWGYLYVAAAKDQKVVMAQMDASAGRAAFAERGTLPKAKAQPANALPARAAPVSALVFQFGKVGVKPVSRWLMLAYDDLYSIQYMKKNLRPYWRRNGWEATDLLKAAAKDYTSLKQRCEVFDAELMADLTQAGGEKYAKLCALAYRQCFAAGKFVADENGRPLQFCKENHSNGCISTSDVFYPMSPQFLLFGPTLAKSFIVPFMNYAASERWTFPFAPHDLGTYPHANGQVYGGGERTEKDQMPVEESGNLLILMGAIAQMEGNANFAGLYWPQLEKWAGYLKTKGFDPENQLCTDDFAGHLAHNVNLSAKAICGLGSFAKLCEMRGEQAKADEYFDLAREFAQRWVKEGDDGEKYRLAFDKTNTWSQKYNLIWDRILGLNLFPAEVARKEMDYYKKVQNQYGLPLDNRKDYTKLDWITWTATLTQNRADFEALIDPVFAFLNETPDRSPMTDWYQTKTARKVGFTARPVVGGVFAQMLYDKAVWRKWAGCDWTAGRLLPTFSTPALVIDSIDISSASSAEIDLFASLEGVVNRTQPRIACVSGADGEGKFTWLDLHKLTYASVSGYSAILKYQTNVTGLVVTDPSQPDTLNLATTIAGVKNELICDPSLLATLTNAPYNLAIMDDLRGRFSNKYLVYGYLYTNFWSQCTHRIMSGMDTNLHGNLRDYLVAVKSATVWLDPGVEQDASTLALFFSGMTAVNGVYMGWWPSEGNGLNWICQYGIPVLASDYFHNASLFSGVSQTISVPPMPPPPPLQNKVYVSLILSDGDNIQYMQHAMKMDWETAARGSIPIGWTVSPLAADLDPAMLNHYWSTATTNDCLISGPSGAGYAHIQKWNAANLAAFTKASDVYLQRSGLRIITIWDQVTTGVARLFATNCPTLLGLTDQSGGTYTSVNLGLRTVGLTVTYSSSTNSIISGITNAAQTWNGTAPLFIAAQANVWNIGPADLQAIASSLDTNKYVVVRPDHLFLLYNRVSGSPRL